MPREWSGSVFRRAGHDTWSAKWKEWNTEQWIVTRGIRTKSEALDLLSKKRREYRQRLRGEFDEFAEHRQRPLRDHLNDFAVHVAGNRRRRAGARSDKHSKQAKARLRLAFGGMGAKSIVDLTQMSVDRFLTGLLDVHRRSVKTRNDYASLLRQFVRWAVADRRLPFDTLGLTRLLSDPDNRKRRQALPWERIRDLAAAMIQRATQKGPKRNRERYVDLARRRALTLTLAHLAGLRRNEVANARWGWFDLTAAVLTVPAEISKSGRTEIVPLHAGLAELLEQERRRRGVADGRAVIQDDLVVGEIVHGRPMLPRHFVDRLRAAAKWIDLPAIDEKGRVLDLHSMRTSFATTLTALGVSDGTRGDLIRHRPSGVTEQHYVQRSLDLLRQAIDLIPKEAAHVEGLWLGTPRVTPTTANTGEHGRAHNGNARAQ